MRRLRTIFVLLLLGAVVNVAVAWGAVLLAGHFHLKIAHYGRSGEYFDTRSTFGHEVVWSLYPAEGVVLEKYPGAMWWDAAELDKMWWGSGFYAAGWPMLSLMGLSDYRQRPLGSGINEWTIRWRPQGVWSSTPLHWLFGERWTGYALDFPYRPRWPGFLVNTLFYAALLALLLNGPGFMRRRFRTWRGRCHRCGYPRSGSETCPECGTTLTPFTA